MTEEELARELRQGLIQTASGIHPELGSRAVQQFNALSDDQVIAGAIKEDQINLEAAKSFIPLCNSRQEWFRFLSLANGKTDAEIQKDTEELFTEQGLDRSLVAGVIAKLTKRTR